MKKEKKEEKTSRRKNRKLRQPLRLNLNEYKHSFIHYYSVQV